MKNFAGLTNHPTRLFLSALILVVLVLALSATPLQAHAPQATATTYTVTNKNSTGAGSLYDAITQANANPGDDTIDFDINHCTILPIIFNLTTSLPIITEGVTIKGPNDHSDCPFPITTNHSPIVLNGGGTLDYGLRLQVGASTIKGLVITNFEIHGIFIESGSTGNVIKGNTIGYYFFTTEYPGNGDSGIKIVSGSFGNFIGGSSASDMNVVSGNGKHGIEIVSSATNKLEGNRIGTNSAGTEALGNELCGINLHRSHSNTIGGSSAGDGNLISGNKRSGICINYKESTNNFIRNNKIGTDVNGTAAIGNLQDGIQLFGAHGTTIGGPLAAHSNLISGNVNKGINLVFGIGTTDTPDNNVIQGNLIGTDITGEVALGNLSTGIYIGSGVSNQIGGSNTGEGNLISGNRTGISIQGNEQSIPQDTTVEGNKIGTNINGSSSIGNQLSGIFVGPNDLTKIGGSSESARNIISGNGSNGILMRSGSFGTVIENNYIGTAANGLGALGNGKTGVYLDHANTVTVGGSKLASGNVIAYNGESGIVLNNGTGILIRLNSIFMNGWLGIDLKDNGVTLNDAKDADSGPNNLQNFPVITNVEALRESTVYRGYLMSEPNMAYMIDLFGNERCDNSGHGEGKLYLGSEPVETDSDGYSEFQVELIPLPDMIKSITATATSRKDDTSEFSKCFITKFEVFLPLVIR